jgi:hypothetical protein
MTAHGAYVYVWRRRKGISGYEPGPSGTLVAERLHSESRPANTVIFILDGITLLSERYKNNMKNSTPTGMFYDCNIKGLWVSEDGVVYSDFNKDIHTATDPSVGVD